MLKNIPLMIVLAASLTACGGSGGGGSKKSSSSVALSSSAPASVAASSEAASSTPASSEAASSTPASSEPASSTPASSEPASSSVASSSAPSNILNIDMTTGWRENGGGTVSYSTDGVTLVATADGQSAVFDLVAPIQLEGAVVEMVVNVSNEYKTSGANLQIFAQIKAGTYPGEYDCWTNNADLTAGTDQTITCTIDEGDDKFNQTTTDVQVGILAKSTTAIAGTVIIKSAKVTLATQASSSSVASSAPVASSSSSSAASGGINADVTKDWEVGNAGGTIAYTANGVVYTPAAPAAYSSGVFFKPVGPFNLEGATLSITMTPDAAFIASGHNPQPFAQVEGGTYAGEWNCWFNNTDLVAGASSTLTCTISEAGAFNITDTTPVRLGFQLTGGTSYAGSVTITAASVVLAQ